MKITNITRDRTLNFVVGIKDGEPVTEAIKPGETKTIDPKHEQLQIDALLLSQQITTGSEARAAPAAPKKETTS